MSLRLWRIPLGMLSVVMINPSISMSPLRILRGRINMDSKRRDLNHPNIRI
jgi:hypothetical protein